MVVNFYNHFNKSIFKSAIISLCVYFALCSVTRESVLQGSSKHKAMSTVQNRHFQKYLSLIRALLNMLLLPFTSNMTEKTQTKKLNKTKIPFSVHIEKYENTWGVWFFLAWFYAMLSSRDKMKSGINLDYGVDSSKCRNVTENLTLLLTADVGRSNMSTTISQSFVKIRSKTKRGWRFKNSPEGNRRDSNLYWNFSEKLLKCFFGSPKLHNGLKKFL